MSLGILRPLSAAFGEVMSRLAGQHSTRLTAAARAEEQVTYGVESVNVTGVGVTVTLIAGTFPGSVLVGQRFRTLGGLAPGVSAIIQAINGPRTQLTLQGTGTGANDGPLSWEIVRDPDTAITVESTLEWSANGGQFYLAGTRYRYAASTRFTLTGIDHWDGTAWISGIAVHVDPPAEVVDYSRSWSALELVRRSFFAVTAGSSQVGVVTDALTVAGSNLGVLRPESIDDPTYLALIRALAYAARGPQLAIDQVLDALIGAGNWETFEDFTSPTADLARVFIRRLNESATQTTGKAFLDGEVSRQITTTTTIALAETPLRVSSVRLADDPPAERIIAAGAGISSTDGITITGPVATFPATIHRGDLLEINTGAFSGIVGTIASRTSSTTIVLGPVQGAPAERVAGAFIAASWRILRPHTNCRFNLPSTDTILEYDADPGTTLWDWIGSVAENVGATIIADATIGDRLFVSGNTAAYRHRARIQPESTAEFEVLFYPSAWAGATTDGRQITIQIRDGARNIAIGFQGVSGSTANLGFIDAGTGAFVGPGPYLWTFATAFRCLRILKRGRGRVFLYLDDQLILACDYTLFAATTATELVIGNLTGANLGSLNIRHMDWHIDTPTDYWNVHAAAATLPGGGSRNIAGLGGLLLVGDVNRTLRIGDFTARNAAGGTGFGEWLISAFVDANTATLQGLTQHAASFQLAHPRFLFVRGDDIAFSYPHNLGHSVEVLAGPNAGVYAIVRLLDPVTFQDLALRFDASAKDTINLATALNDVSEVLYTSVVELAAPPAGFVDDGNEYDWRIVPTGFPIDAGPIPAEIVDTGSVAGVNLTLRQALPLAAAGGWTPLVAVGYSLILSAVAEDENTANTQPTPGNYTERPFYLYDSFGYIRDQLDLPRAAGVVVDVDSLVRDPAIPTGVSGLHIVEE